MLYMLSLTLLIVQPLLATSTVMEEEQAITLTCNPLDFEEGEMPPSCQLLPKKDFGPSWQPLTTKGKRQTLMDYLGSRSFARAHPGVHAFIQAHAHEYDFFLPNGQHLNPKLPLYYQVSDAQITQLCFRPAFQFIHFFYFPFEGGVQSDQMHLLTIRRAQKKEPASSSGDELDYKPTLRGRSHLIYALKKFLPGYFHAVEKAYSGVFDDDSRSITSEATSIWMDDDEETDEEARRLAKKHALALYAVQTGHRLHKNGICRSHHGLERRPSRAALFDALGRSKDLFIHLAHVPDVLAMPREERKKKVLAPGIQVRVQVEGCRAAAKSFIFLPASYVKSLEQKDRGHLDELLKEYLAAYLVSKQEYRPFYFAFDPGEENQRPIINIFFKEAEESFLRQVFHLFLLLLPFLGLVASKQGEETTQAEQEEPPQASAREELLLPMALLSASDSENEFYDPEELKELLEEEEQVRF